MRALVTFAFALTLLPNALTAQNAPAEQPRPEFRYQNGDISLEDGIAQLKLGTAFRYLDPKQTSTLLEAWGNPPNPDTLGMIFPAELDPLSESGWGVIVTYEEDGYVDDEGAEKIDYDDLLEEMQRDIRASNKQRVESGFDAIELVGWAEAPRYDATSHKLYWAKDLSFGNEDGHTLNYNIRVLGRRGVLVLNAVSSLAQLAEIKPSMTSLLSAVEFHPGYRYTDYLPGKDKLASYGVGALVAGTLASKAGLFKGLIAALLATKKLVAVGLVALFAFLSRLVKGRQAKPEEPIEPA